MGKMPKRIARKSKTAKRVRNKAKNDALGKVKRPARRVKKKNPMNKDVAAVMGAIASRLGVK